MLKIIENIFFILILSQNLNNFVLTQDAEPTCSNIVNAVLKISNCTCIQTRELGALPNVNCFENADAETYQNMFMLLSTFITNNNEKKFGRFAVKNDVDFEINENFFGNITFKEVHLGTTDKECHISRVHYNAFNGPISGTLEILTVRSNKLGYNNDMFKSLLKLKNLRKVTIEGKYLTHIPRKAFCENTKSKESSFPYLEEIRFHANEGIGLIFIRSIGARAFWNLPSLRLLSIESQDLEKIGVRAFGLPEPSDTKLVIDLSRQWNSNFSFVSFMRKTFSELNRPIELNLYGNSYLIYLKEEVFYEFFKQNPNNRLHLGQEFLCDCNILWLYRNKQFKEQIIPWSYEDSNIPENYVLCSNEIELWNLEEDHFQSCPEYQEKPKEEL